jgi:hypothetical protein
MNLKSGSEISDPGKKDHFDPQKNESSEPDEHPGKDAGTAL